MVLYNWLIIYKGDEYGDLFKDSKRKCNWNFVK
jgi:hypothetical protein